MKIIERTDEKSIACDGCESYVEKAAIWNEFADDSKTVTLCFDCITEAFVLHQQND